MLQKKSYCPILKIIEIEMECLLPGTLEINDNLTFVYDMTYRVFRLRTRFCCLFVVYSLVIPVTPPTTCVTDDFLF